MFTATEALGLVMAVLDGHHDASDTTDPVGSALGKIVRALPEPVAAQAEAVRRSTAPAPDRAAARPDHETTSALVNACSSHRRVRLGYRSEAGSEWVVEADPWAVVVRHGRWYLLCHSHAVDARRAYRIDRVRKADVLEDTFTPPADLDSVMREEHLAVGWEYDVEVVIDAALDAVSPCVPRSLGRLEPVDAATTRLVGSTSNPAGTPSSSRRFPRRTGSCSAPSSGTPPASSVNGCSRPVRLTGPDSLSVAAQPGSHAGLVALGVG